MTALLAHAASCGDLKSGADISRYIRRVITFDPPYLCLGFPQPPEAYNPLQDPDIPLEQRPRHFSMWVSGYYQHGDLISGLEYRTPLSDPPPTLSTMTREVIESLACPAPTAPNGPDMLMFTSNMARGTVRDLRLSALYPSEDSSGWSEVEWRYVWCDRSVWEMPWAVAGIQNDLAQVEGGSKHARKLTIVRWRGANHFSQWDKPEQTLRGLLADSDEDVDLY